MDVSHSACARLLTVHITGQHSTETGLALHRCIKVKSGPNSGAKTLQLRGR